MNKKDLLDKIQALYEESVNKSANPAWRVKKPEHFIYVPEKRVMELKTYIKEIFNVIGVKKFNKTLDMGAGRGELCFALAEFSDEVIGLEPDSFSSKIAELLKEYFETKNVDFIAGIGEKLPFKDNDFDLVVSTSTLEHMPDWKESLKEIHRVLKNNGIFFLNVPNYFWFREPHYELPMLPLMPKFILRIFAYFTGRNPQYINHIQYLTPRRLEKELKENGFEIRNITEEQIKKSLVERGGSRRKIVVWLKKLKLNRIAAAFFIKTKAYPHIILISKKN